jgi:hypothetical protein
VLLLESQKTEDEDDWGGHSRGIPTFIGLRRGFAGIVQDEGKISQKNGKRNRAHSSKLKHSGSVLPTRFGLKIHSANLASSKRLKLTRDTGKTH